MNQKKRLSGIAAAFAILACSCTGNGAYTRGIGIYPGKASEDFSPELKPDDSYRNLALHRAAYQSSGHDYNLTAQLVTDGIITDRLPEYLVLSTPEGVKPRREREWMVDQGPYSRNTTSGEDTYFQFDLKNYSRKADRIRFRGSVAYDDDKAGKGYEFVAEGSRDGLAWEILGKLSGSGLPGTGTSYRMHTDPNKQGGKTDLPVRSIEYMVPLEKTGDYQAYRIRFRMEGAALWTINDMDFFYGNIMTEMKPSQFFSSCWMSETGEKEWIYIDLGNVSSFDRVILHWIEKAEAGKIQVSDDAAAWKDIAELPGGRNHVDDIAVNGKARFVRILMERPLKGENYMLSEAEIMGTGGLVPHPVQQPPAGNGIILLSGGNWKLQRASEVVDCGEKISSSGFKTENWIIATVPGTVLSSYRNIGSIPDPNYSDNQLNISESFFNSDFWYRDEFEVPEGFAKDRVFLDFDGINWKAVVYMNGKELGKIDGAFMRGRFDVTGALKTGKNVIAVRIIRNEHIGAVKEKNKESTDFNGGILGADNPTFHATIGWDWIPTIRGRNIGIWNDVRLVTTGKVTVSDPFVESVLPLPDTSSARLTAGVIVHNCSDEPVEGTLEGWIGETGFSRKVTLDAGEERTVVFGPDEYAQLEIKHPRLWWPNGYGDQHLYDAGFRFVIGGAESDRKTFKAGIRQMTYSEDGDRLEMYINGRRFIGRGGNWGFSESNLNYRRREYDIAVAYHADMNFTIMRNWVGMTGDEELYEACDRYGIMVWQDFWLANPSDGPDPYYPEMFIANAEDYVRRIRNHASLCLYCGRNEGFPPEKIDTALRRIVREEHPGMHYIPSSADEVVSGHGPYRMLPAKTYFTLETGNDKFHSERGMPNVLTYESFRRTYSVKGMWPQSDEWGIHDYTLEGAQGAVSFNEIISKGYGEAGSAKEFTEKAQWVNYDGHRSLFESRSKNRMGLLMWMSHSCWPSMVWQTYDYYFEPTAAYFAIKKASEPLHIQWNPATDYVEIVNYSAGNRRNLTAEVRILNMDASVAWERSVTTDSFEDSTNECIRLEFPDSLSEVHFIKLKLSENGRIISENFYHRSLVENDYTALGSLGSVRLKSDFDVSECTDGIWKASVTLKNVTDIPALMIRLDIVGNKDGDQFLPIFYEDNYFSLMPGEEKTIAVRWKEEDTRGNSPLLKISGFNICTRHRIF